MTVKDFFEWITDELLRKSVRNWVKRNPKTLDMRTDVIFGGKRYLIHIRRSDYRDYKENANENKDNRKV